MGRRGRYAGTEPQSFGGGMENMTIHDTMQGSSMNRPGPRPSPLGGGENGMNGDREGRGYAGMPAICTKGLSGMHRTHAEHDGT